MPFQGHLSSNHLNRDISLIFSQFLHKNCSKIVSFMQVLLDLDTCINNFHESLIIVFPVTLKIISRSFKFK